MRLRLFALSLALSVPALPVLPAMALDLPAAPEPLSVQKTDSTQVTLSWTPAPAEAEVTDYVVEQSTAGGNWSIVTDGIGGYPGALVNALVPGTHYAWRVSAVNAAGQGPATAAVEFDLLPVPAQVTGVSVLDHTSSSVHLLWIAPNDGGSPIIDYMVSYRPIGGEWVTFDDGTSPYASAVVLNLDLATTYEFSIAAVNAFAAGAWSEPIVETPSDVPAAPVAAIDHVLADSVSMHWTAPDGFGAAIDDYRVIYRMSGSKDWETFDDGVSSATSLVVTGLTPFKRYEFKVQAANRDGFGPLGPLVAATPKPLPERPSVQVIGHTADTVSFAWAAVDDGGYPVLDYEIQFKLDGDTQWQSLITDMTPHLDAVLTGLTAGVPAQLRVRAVNEVGAGEWSLAVGDFPSAVPDAPQPFIESQSGDSVTLAWSEPAGNGAPISSYAVDFRAVGAEEWQRLDAGESTRVQIPGLIAGSTYEFSVAAVNRDGFSEWSDVATVVASARPAAVELEVADHSGESISLSWTAAVSDLPVSDYVVNYRVAGGDWLEWQDEVSTETSAIVGDLQTGTSYEFRVAAVSDAGRGDWSSVVSETPSTEPAAPKVDSALASTSSVVLNWRAPASRGAAITDYVVQYRKTGDKTWTVFSDGVNAEVGAVVTGLSGKQTYEFRVAAVNRDGQSAYSAALSATPGSSIGKLTVLGLPKVKVYSGEVQTPIIVFKDCSDAVNKSNCVKSATKEVQLQVKKDNGWTTLSTQTPAKKLGVCTAGKKYAAGGGLIEFTPLEGIFRLFDPGSGAFSDNFKAYGLFRPTGAVRLSVTGPAFMSSTTTPVLRVTAQEKYSDGRWHSLPGDSQVEVVDAQGKVVGKYRTSAWVSTQGRLQKLAAAGVSCTRPGPNSNTRAIAVKAPSKSDVGKHLSSYKARFNGKSSTAFSIPIRVAAFKKVIVDWSALTSGKGVKFTSIGSNGQPGDFSVVLTLYFKPRDGAWGAVVSKPATSAGVLPTLSRPGSYRVIDNQGHIWSTHELK